ncbi:MAG: metal ABC transporter substrate-binding protein [Planctomycetota bacterium]
MRSTLLALLLVCSLGSFASTAKEQLRVVTTLPSLADIAKEIGGERLRVDSIARGRENLHSMPTRPSALVAANRADLIVQLGLGLEHAFLPGLLRAAKNEAIQPGTDGYLNCAVGWEPIQIPPSLSRRNGVDLHPEGNPHYHLSVRAGEHIADRLLEALVRRDPGSAKAYRAGHARYVERVRRARKRWAPLAERLAGARVVQFHLEFDYLLRDYGIETIATVEPAPGVMPSPKDLARLAERMRELEIDTIVTAAWSNNRFVQSLADLTGATILELPHMVGAADGTDTWIELQDELNRRLAKRFPAPDEGRLDH